MGKLIDLLANKQTKLEIEKDVMQNRNEFGKLMENNNVLEPFHIFEELFRTIWNYRIDK